MSLNNNNILLFMKNKYHESLLTHEIKSRFYDSRVISIQSKREALDIISAENIQAIIIVAESGNQKDICNIHQIHLRNDSIPIIALVDSLEDMTEKLKEVGITEIVLKDELFYISVSQLLKEILAIDIIDDFECRVDSSIDQSEQVKLTSSLLAHEINNPLMTILGVAELILDEPSKYDQNLIEKIRIIQKSALRIKKSTYRMTNLSKPVYQKTPYGVMIDPQKSRISSKSKVKLTETE